MTHAFTVSIHSCKQSIFCGILLWSTPLFPEGWRLYCTSARYCSRGWYADSSSTSSRSRCPLLHVFLNFASSVDFALFTYARLPSVGWWWSTWTRIRGSLSAPLAPQRVEGDGHGVAKHVVATYFMAMCCAVPLTPCVGCHFKPGAIPRILNRVSDSPRRVSESLGGRDSLHLTTGFRFQSAGATCSRYLAPSWVGASGLDMFQRGRHPKDWLSGGISPCRQPTQLECCPV